QASGDRHRKTDPCGWTSDHRRSDNCRDLLCAARNTTCAKPGSPASDPLSDFVFCSLRRDCSRPVQSQNPASCQPVCAQSMRRITMAKIMKPLVSILIPAYNAETWIADTIKSAIGQSWPHKEIIVVDDGSTDQTLAIA